MILETNVAVTYNSGLTGNITEVIRGVIKSKTFFKQGVEIIYTYSNINNEIIKEDSFVVDNETAEVLFSAIKNDLPDINLGFIQFIDNVFYKAMKVEMVNTFQELTDVSQITLK